MKSTRIAAASVSLLLFAVAVSEAQEMPEMPSPQPEHQWLERFVGEWRLEGKCSMGPDAPPMESKGTQRARMLGGFWMVAEAKSSMMGMQFESILTLGYDPKLGKYVGSWIDSVTDYMWHYEGSVSSDGNVLTLTTEGPNLVQPGSTANYRETIEFKSDDQYVFSSAIEGENGEWQTMMTANYYRTK